MHARAREREGAASAPEEQGLNWRLNHVLIRASTGAGVTRQGRRRWREKGLRTCNNNVRRRRLCERRSAPAAPAAHSQSASPRAAPPAGDAAAAAAAAAARDNSSDEDAAAAAGSSDDDEPEPAFTCKREFNLVSREGSVTACTAHYGFEARRAQRHLRCTHTHANAKPFFLVPQTAAERAASEAQRAGILARLHPDRTQCNAVALALPDGMQLTTVRASALLCPSRHMHTSARMRTQMTRADATHAPRARAGGHRGRGRGAGGARLRGVPLRVRLPRRGARGRGCARRRVSDAAALRRVPAPHAARDGVREGRGGETRRCAALSCARIMHPSLTRASPLPSSPRARKCRRAAAPRTAWARALSPSAAAQRRRRAPAQAALLWPSSRATLYSPARAPLRRTRSASWRRCARTHTPVCAAGSTCADCAHLCVFVCCGRDAWEKVR
jgi:hypothetical protein